MSQRSKKTLHVSADYICRWHFFRHYPWLFLCSLWECQFVELHHLTTTPPISIQFKKSTQAALQRPAGTTTVQITDMPGIFQNKSEQWANPGKDLQNQHGRQCKQPSMMQSFYLGSNKTKIRSSIFSFHLKKMFQMHKHNLVNKQSKLQPWTKRLVFLSAACFPLKSCWNLT